MDGAIWVVAERSDGRLAQVSGEVATLARDLAERAGTEAVGVVVATDPSPAATELAAYLHRVLAVRVDDAADHCIAAVVANTALELMEREHPGLVLVGATQEGRDLAGLLSGCLGWGVLTNAGTVEWRGAPVVGKAVFGGGLLTTSRLLEDRGIITVLPGAVAATAAAVPGVVEIVEATGGSRLPLVPVLDRMAAGGAAELTEARVIVSGGRGVGGPDGFAIIGELARALGGSVGASLAAADAGWIDYSRVIGQTGKIVKPSLYVAVGISGALQHRAGIEGAGTVVAINTDPEAPIAAFADLLVVGDFRELAPAITAELRARPAQSNHREGARHGVG